MKKFTTILSVLLVVLMLSTAAFASESIKVTGSYSDGKLYWNVSDFCDLYTVWANGTELVNYSQASGSYKIALDTTEDITIKVVDLMGHSDTYTIEAKPVVTEAPATEAPATEAPATEAPATEAPATEAPATEAPATEAPATEAPATEKPVEPTEKPVEPTEKPVVTKAPAADDEVEDDDVPKTGDTTIVFVSVAMLLAAAYLVSRRFVRA